MARANKNKKTTGILLPFALMALAIVVWLFMIDFSTSAPASHSVACTEEAKICPDGSAVGRTGPDCAFAPCPKTAAGTCRRTGCSGQVCSDTEVVSTCEYRTEYACYQTATCERQASGACGWTMTQELERCLADTTNGNSNVGTSTSHTKQPEPG